MRESGVPDIITIETIDENIATEIQEVDSRSSHRHFPSGSRHTQKNQTRDEPIKGDPKASGDPRSEIFAGESSPIRLETRSNYPQKRKNMNNKEMKADYSRSPILCGFSRSKASLRIPSYILQSAVVSYGKTAIFVLFLSFIILSYLLSYFFFLLILCRLSFCNISFIIYKN